MRNDTNEQGYFLVPKSWLNAIEETQQKILSLLSKDHPAPETAIEGYISEAEAKKFFGRKTTWFWQMRTSGRLPFAKVGSKVFYQKADIIKLLKAGKKDDMSDGEPPLKNVA